MELSVELCWELWESMDNYISNKEKAEAIDAFLQVLYNNNCDIVEFKEYVEENTGDKILIKGLNTFISDYDLGDD